MTDDSPDVVEQRARIAKLSAETQLVRHQLSPTAQRNERLKAIANLAGLITGVTAILGLVFSVWQSSRSADVSREVQIEERFTRSLTLLGDTSPSARLAGVVSLNSFLHGDHKKQVREVLLAFTNALALEPSQPVRNALVASIDNLDMAAIEQHELDGALLSLVQVSRGLVQEGTLWRERRSNFYFPPPVDTVESRAVSVAAAVTALLRKNGRIADMSRTYLAGEDFRNLNLSGVSFDDSILASSDFRGAVLEGASFTDADLYEVNFTGAQLRGASFRQTITWSIYRELHYDYVEEQIRRRLDWWQKKSPQPLRNGPPQFFIGGPDFSCADLRQADFTGHPLLPVFPDSLPDSVHMLTLSFRGANLLDAKFSTLKVFGIGYKENEVPRSPYPLLSDARAWSGLPGGYVSFVRNVLDDAPTIPNTAGHAATLRELGRIFTGSNWKEATMPKAVAAALDQVGAESKRTDEGCGES